MTLGPSQPPTPSCILYIDVLGSHCSSSFNNHDGVIRVCVSKACISSKYSKCISAIKRILYITAMYTSSSSFVYLCFFLFTAMHVKSLAFCVWEWRRYTQYNTILQACADFEKTASTGGTKKTQLLQESALNGHFAYARITFLVRLPQVCELYTWRVALVGDLINFIAKTEPTCSVHKQYQLPTDMKRAEHGLTTRSFTNLHRISMSHTKSTCVQGVVWWKRKKTICNG